MIPVARMGLTRLGVEQNADDSPVGSQEADFVDEQIVETTQTRAKRLALMFMRRGAHAGERIGKLVGLDPFAGLRRRKTLRARRRMFGMFSLFRRARAAGPGRDRGEDEAA